MDVNYKVRQEEKVKCQTFKLYKHGLSKSKKKMFLMVLWSWSLIYCSIISFIVFFSNEGPSINDVTHFFDIFYPSLPFVTHFTKWQHLLADTPSTWSGWHHLWTAPDMEVQPRCNSYFFKEFRGKKCFYKKQ